MRRCSCATSIIKYFLSINSTSHLSKAINEAISINYLWEKYLNNCHDFFLSHVSVYLGNLFASAFNEIIVSTEMAIKNLDETLIERQG